MKRIVASVGLVALGASGLNAVYGQDTAPLPYKPWNISASLRGFYDDNPNCAPDGSTIKQGSFGFSVSPGVGLDWQNGQTMVKLSYNYTLEWFDKRPLAASRYDQTHEFDGELDHAFNELYQASVTDSFVVGQEPDMLRSGLFVDSFKRINGDNIRNAGTITLNGQLTPVFGLEAGYANTLFEYQDSGAKVYGPFGVGKVVGPLSITNFIPGPSLAGSLNRVMNTLHLDGRWQIMPQTIGVLGYQFSLTSYTGDEPIAVVSRTTGSGTNAVTTQQTLNSNSRDNRAHYFYVGADHNFTPDLAGSIRAGVRDTDYYNDPTASSSVSPYVNFSLKDNYAVESYLEVGFSYDRTPIDEVGSGTSQTDITRDAESTVIFAQLNHRILPSLYGSLLAQFQNSTFNGGTSDGKSDRYFMLGLDLQYRVNAHLAVDAGYNYDQVNSDLYTFDSLGHKDYYRNFDRNRVYIGLTAKY